MKANEGGVRRNEKFAVAAHDAVREVIGRQLQAGIDVINDGEQSKPSFQSYFLQRLSGFERQRGVTAQGQRASSREYLAFKEYYDWVDQREPSRELGVGRCTGPIGYIGLQDLGMSLENIRSAIEGASYSDVFVTCIAPSYIAATTPNQYYASDEEYEQAIADAMAVEYKAIVAAGFVVQLDDPRLISYYTNNPQASVEDCIKWAQHRVELINYSIRDLPRDMVRFHTCYSINIGPRVHEMELRDFIDVMLAIDVGAYSFEAANPRHEHVYHVFEDTTLPEGRILIPGVISHTTNLVEHPELVAERIVRFAKLVGRGNVIAGADCGFSTSASNIWEIHPSVVWHKFAALVAGARLASRELWR
jgi:5-methyltetrahydropteroyltriglutamate--homocysteine methyltransferase